MKINDMIWVQFPNDAAYALASYGPSSTALLGFLPYDVYVIVCVKS